MLATAATVVLAARWVPVVTAPMAVAAQLAAPVLMVRSSAVLAVMVLLVAMVETVAPGVLVDRSQVMVDWAATGVVAVMVVPVVRAPMALTRDLVPVVRVAMAQMVVAVVPVAWVARLFPRVFPARKVTVATVATEAPLALVVTVDRALVASMLLDCATVPLAVPVEMPVLEASGVLAGAVQLMGRLVR